MLATEKHEGLGAGSETDSCSFKLVVSRPALVFSKELLSTCGGNKEHAENVSTVLLSREYGALKAEAAARKGTLSVAVDGQPAYSVAVSKDFYWTVGDSLRL